MDPTPLYILADEYWILPPCVNRASRPARWPRASGSGPSWWQAPPRRGVCVPSARWAAVSAACWWSRAERTRAKHSANYESERPATPSNSSSSESEDAPLSFFTMVLTRPPPPDLVRSASSLLPSSSPTRREWHDGHGEGSDDGGNGTQAVGMTLLPLEIEMSGRKQRGRNVSDVPSAARKPDIASLMTTVPPLTGCLAWSSAPHRACG
jgi:hypothetical protein